MSVPSNQCAQSNAGYEIGELEFDVEEIECNDGEMA